MKHLVLIGIVGLFIASCGSDEKSKENGDTEKVVSNMKAGEIKMAFFNSDSIPNQFDFYKSEMQKLEGEGLKLEQKATAMQNNYQAVATKFQNELNANVLSDNQKMTYQGRLEKMQNEMAMFQQNEMGKFQQKQYESTEVLMNKIAKYSETYAKEKGLTMFFARGQGSGVAYADPALDLTASFIAYMNEQEKALNGEEK